MDTAAAATLAINEPDKPMQRVTLDVHGVHVTVAAEDVVRLILDRMRDSASMATPVHGLPRIGVLWPEQGGIYCGLVRGDNGAADYHLILAELALLGGQWKPAMDWAKSLVVGRFSDFTLPKRKEQSVLFGNVPECFEREWYWSSEEHSNDEYAWCQSFHDGLQLSYHKDTNDVRARAVRRVPLSNSVL